MNLLQTNYKVVDGRLMIMRRMGLTKKRGLLTEVSIYKKITKHDSKFCLFYSMQSIM